MQSKQRQGKELTFRSFRNPPILSTLSTQGDEFLHQRLARQEHISIRKTKGKISRVRSLTSSKELVGSCASREMSASLDFFYHLVLRDTVTFLIEDLVTRGASAESFVSCTEGLSGTAACGEGAAVTSGCGSSSSLQTRNRFFHNPKERSKERQ
jgi:hypothetical protein